MLPELKKIKKPKRKKFHFNSLEYRHLDNFIEYFFKDYQLIASRPTPFTTKAVLLKVEFSIIETRSNFIVKILDETKRFPSLLVMAEYIHRKVMRKGISETYYDEFPHLEAAIPRGF